MKTGIKIRVEHINVYLNAAMSVIQMNSHMYPMNLIPHGAAFIKKDKNSTGNISSLVSIHTKDNKYKGNVIISMNTIAAVEINRCMIGDSFTEINDDVKDCIGEIVNQLSGVARAKLARLKEFPLILLGGTPSTIVGSDYRITTEISTDMIAIPLIIEGVVKSKILIEFGLEEVIQ